MLKKLVFLTLVLCTTIFAQNTQNFYLASWNVENLFDIYDDPQKDDQEFLPGSDKKWDQAKYQTKLENLAKVINGMNENTGPDILGLVEIENRSVLDDLKNEIQKSSTKKYEIVHVESLDERGIDNALFFNQSLFQFKELVPLKVEFSKEKFDTRYILRIHLKILGNVKDNDLYVYVNHWPSRRGGEDQSEVFRMDAANTLLKDIAVINKKSVKNIVIIGDFNDEPINKSITEVLKAKQLVQQNKLKKNDLFNLAWDIKANKLGSFMYKQEWNMLDQMIISQPLVNNKGLDYVDNSFEVIKPDYMITKEGKYKDSPIPTFGGKSYLAGYSDHFPVGAKFAFKLKTK